MMHSTKIKSRFWQTQTSAAEVTDRNFHGRDQNGSEEVTGLESGRESVQGE
jgi:hypothetical protein